MNHPFSSELQQLLHEAFALGKYQNEDELLIEAVRLLRQRDADLERFQQNLKTRLDRLDRGEAVAFEDDAALRAFFDDVQARGHDRYPAGSDVYWTSRK